MSLEPVATIGVPRPVAGCLAQLVAALGGPVTLIGGWAAEPVRLEADEQTGESVLVALPRAGALFAAKMANLDLEDRPPKKRAGDAEDAVRLLSTFGALALAGDLGRATEAERLRLRYLVGATRASGLLAAVRNADVERDEERLGGALAAFVDDLNRDRRSVV
ncbi:MAG TPA: hypothetical protein VNU01_07810 [Egibacteraceae bacterium]|nr:hypothetical protein [Egibacteraceae bacterium]